METTTQSLPAVSTDGTASRTWIERLWATIADRGRAYVNVPAGSVAPVERARQLALTLVSERGEASGAALARELHLAVDRLDVGERRDFYAFLAENFQPNETRLRAAAEAYLSAPTPEHAAELAEAADPMRQELLRRMNSAPGGMAALVRMRQELLGHLRAEPALRPLDTDLKHLLASWFNRGFLELRRIDWQTPAAVLEKLIAYEAVHEIQGWEDLRRRLAPDRRCFGFFHPALPGEPLIFVEVALTRGLADAVQPLLARDGGEHAADAAAADTAIFYSISNCQDGLRGISFGNFLIKQVVEELKAELPQLVQFSTLSPVPGMRRWLDAKLAAEPADVTAEEIEALRALADEDLPAESLRPILGRLCAAYLTGSAADRRAADPVARFHLGNGAQLERINWHGNVAPRGIRESYGIMVNYLYDRDRIEANHEAFVRGEVVRSPAVDALMGLSRSKRRG